MSKEDLMPLYFEKTIRDWAKEYCIPPSQIYLWLEMNKEFTEKDFMNCLTTFKNKISLVEATIKDSLEIDSPLFFLNNNFSSNIKLNNSIQLNVDSLYWHSEIEMSNNRYYHLNLRKELENKGIRILQFREDEIVWKLDIIKSMVNNLLKKTKVKIGARKTILKKVPPNEAREFLKQNHIKGYKTAKNIGLYYNDELISIMSYKLGTNLKTKKQFVKVDRFCSKNNYNVVGAFSKLLKQIELELPGLPLHYWVDLRYGTGDFLLNHNFKLEKETLGWEWTDFKQTYNRLKCRANMDERKLTEKEHAKELGWARIFDAGQRLYIKET
jgi:hypothetical protein